MTSGDDVNRRSASTYVPPGGTIVSSVRARAICTSDRLSVRLSFRLSAHLPVRPSIRPSVRQTTSAQRDNSTRSRNRLIDEPYPSIRHRDAAGYALRRGRNGSFAIGLPPFEQVLIIFFGSVRVRVRVHGTHNIDVESTGLTLIRRHVIII